MVLWGGVVFYADWGEAVPSGKRSGRVAKYQEGAKEGDREKAGFSTGARSYRSNAGTQPAQANNNDRYPQTRMDQAKTEIAKR